MTKKLKITIIRVLLLSGTAVFLFFVPWILVWAWILPLPDTVQEQLEETLTYGFDGMIVYVNQAGKAPEHYAAGWHDKKDEIPAKPNALFKIASISKLYVAVAITKLVNEKQLSLDKTLAEYFPELKDRIEHADEITLDLVVKHRSGIPNFTDYPTFWSDPPESGDEILELVLDEPAKFKPDKGYGYSNTNYLLLAMLMDRTLGYDHFEYIKENILLPLGLKNTFGSLNEVNINDVMSGYYVGIEDDFKTKDYGMLATAEDVGIFLRALNDGTLFSEAEQEIYSSIYVYEHTGLVPGYQSIAKYHKKTDTVVIQFTSTTDFEGYNWNLSEIMYSRIVKIVHKKHNA